jgi:hypothetical protein
MPTSETNTTRSRIPYPKSSPPTPQSSPHARLSRAPHYRGGRGARSAPSQPCPTAPKFSPCNRHSILTPSRRTTSRDTKPKGQASPCCALRTRQAKHTCHLEAARARVRRRSLAPYANTTRLSRLSAKRIVPSSAVRLLRTSYARLS